MHGLSKYIEMHRSRIISFIWLIGLIFIMIFSSTNTGDSGYFESNKHLTASQISAAGRGSIQINQNEGVFWFIHITDTQSMWRSKEKTDMFVDFLNISEQYIKPAFYLHTGDIVDSDYHNFFAHNQGQLAYEWNNYSQSLQTVNMTSDIYFDVMGNHDTYADPEYKWFRNSSMQKTPMYDFIKQYPFGKYHFLGLHTPENLGAKYPFSLFGYLSDSELDWYESKLQSQTDARVTVAFGHHPAYEMFQGGIRFNQLNRKYGVDLYLVGHGHMDTYEEIESGTVSYMTPKLSNQEKSYRIIAIYGDIISESIQAYDNWPVGMICSPADHKNVYLDYNRNQLKSADKIRALAFDKESVIKVEWRSDINQEWKPMTNQFGPLYEADWDSSLNDGKIHAVEIRITNSRGAVKIESIEFSSEKIEHFGWKYGSRIIILTVVGLFAVPITIKAKKRWLEPSKYRKPEDQNVDPALKKNMLIRLALLLFVPLTFAEIWPGKWAAVFGLYYIGNGGIHFYDNNLLFGAVVILFSILLPSSTLSKKRALGGLITFPLSILFSIVGLVIYVSRSLISLISPGYLLLIALDLLAIKRAMALRKK